MAGNLELIRKQREALEKQNAAASKKRRKAAVETNSAGASRPIIWQIRERRTITEKDHSDSSAGNGTTDFHIKMNMKSAE